MVKTVRNMFNKKQKVPFQPLTLDIMGYKHLAQTTYKPLDESANSLKGSEYNLYPGLSADDTQVIMNPRPKEVVLSLWARKSSLHVSGMQTHISRKWKPSTERSGTNS